MVYLQIEAEILINKHLEFSQSKLAFMNDIQKAPGYINFIEKPGNKFKIEVSWEDQLSLDNFIQTEQFHFFKGAIKTLSQKNVFKVLKED